MAKQSTQCLQQNFGVSKNTKKDSGKILPAEINLFVEILNENDRSLHLTRVGGGLSSLVSSEYLPPLVMLHSPSWDKRNLISCEVILFTVDRYLTCRVASQTPIFALQGHCHFVSIPVILASSVSINIPIAQSTSHSNRVLVPPMVFISSKT